jgi:DNA mismatch endonuclease (patch repair protein)
LDRLDLGRRSDNMRRIRPKDTTPEMCVRRLVHGLGFRYRLHCRDLPGKPDLVFRTRKKVIFVNGCFWHRHPGCPYAYTPKTRVEFWTAKLDGNRMRDLRNLEVLEKQGWKALTVWECETIDLERLTRLLRRFLQAGPDVAAAKRDRTNE